MITDLLAEARNLLKQQGVPEPYEVTMPASMWLKLQEELAKTYPYVPRATRRFVGRIGGFEVYVDDDAPRGQVRFQGVPR